MEFSRQQLIGLGGGVLLLLGIFLPIVSLPLVGSMSIFNTGRVDGYVLLGLAVASLALAFINQLKPLRITGAISAVLVTFGFIHIIYKLNKMKSSFTKDLKGNPFSGVADAMMSTVQIQYGWVFLFIGCFMLLYAAFGKHTNTRPMYVDVRQAEPEVSNTMPTISNKPQTRLVAEDMFSHNAGKFIEKPQDFKSCPFCSEQIRITAIKCKHCGSMLEEAS